MKKIEFYLDDAGDITIIDDGEEITTKDDSAVYIKQFLVLEEIKKRLLEDARIVNNETLRENLASIIKNYYMQRMVMMENLHNQILQLAINDTREDIEAEE